MAEPVPDHDSDINNGEKNDEEDSHWDGIIDDQIIAAREQEYNELTEEELREELRLRELNSEGTKEQLIARLMSDDFDEEEDIHTEEMKVAEEDEFVEWNKDGEMPDLDEIKEDDVAAEGDKSETTKMDEKVEATVSEENYNLDISSDKDLFYITWHGNKLSVPFKSEISKDMICVSKLQNIIIYPIGLVDLSNAVLIKFLKLATTINMELEEASVGISKGYLRVKFRSVNEAALAIEELKAKMENVTIVHYSREDCDVGEIMSAMKDQALNDKGPTLNRLVYIANIPIGTDEKQLKQLFPGCEQIILPEIKSEEGKTNRYAYAEYAKEEDAYEAADTMKNTQIGENVLYIIKAITEKKDKYGLMSDQSRGYFSEQVRRIKKLLTHARDKEPWELEQCESKLVNLEERLARDKRRREALLLAPCTAPLEERKKEERNMSKSSKEDRQKSKSPHRSTSHKKSSHATRSFTSRTPKDDGSADRLVHQLAGIVSALSDKIPTKSPPRSSRGAYRRSYTSSSAPRRPSRFPRYASNYSRDSYMESKGSAYQNSGAYPSYSRSYSRSSYRGGASSPSERYQAMKRSRDDDLYSSERKRRIGDYLDTSSSRYTSREDYDNKYMSDRRPSYSTAPNGQASYSSRGRGRSSRGSYPY